MIYMHFECPPTPHFIAAGKATYRKGDKHKKRSNIGVFDLLFVVSGRLYIVEENEHYVLDKNQLLILSPDKTHHSYKLCDTETVFYWLHMGCTGSFYESGHLHPVNRTVSKSLFRDTLFYITLPKYHQLPEPLADTLKKYIEPLLMFTINKYNSQTESTTLTTRNYTNLNSLQQQRLFVDILNLLNLDTKFSNASDSLASEVMQYIQNNYRESFTIKDLAKKYNFHPVHIIRCMKNSYHITPIQALTTIRLEKSRELLLTTESSIREISEAVGFSSSAYFTKQFKSYYGVTPSEFRLQSSSGAYSSPL